jgi:uncharacterized repeat protein (TIGR03803 family)
MNVGGGLLLQASYGRRSAVRFKGAFVIRDLSKVLLAGACALAFAAPALAGSFTILHKFKGGRNEGMNPYGPLTPDGLGNLYGTTTNGGHKACGPYGCGTVYRIAADGTLTTVYAFTGKEDGSRPTGGLALSPDGSLYGTTTEGGSGQAGTAYRVTPDGQESVVYAFSGGADGNQPGGIVLDEKGNIYGVTTSGGQYSLGTLFKITPVGKEKQLHVFAENQNDGGEPTNAPIFDKAGNLFGSTPWGGSTGAGTIFKVTPQGEYSVFYNFPDGSGGAQPRTDLLMDKAGNFYGTTSGGGDYGYGAVFKLSPSGTETVLHSFSGGGSGDGAYPQAGVIVDRKGNLYGATSGQGAGTAGNVFELAPDGTERVLHAFGGGKDGDYPVGTLVSDGFGNLYGTAEGGGSTKGVCNPYGCGTVFSLPEK